MTVGKQNLLPVCSGHLEFALFLSECLNGISKYSNFESRQFQSISAKFSDWGLLRSPQSEASDW